MIIQKQQKDAPKPPDPCGPTVPEGQPPAPEAEKKESPEQLRFESLFAAKRKRSQKMRFATEEQALLKKLVFAIIENQCSKKSLQDALDSKEFAPLLGHPALNECCGVFVTLKKNGDLRGCIGTFSETSPLIQNIITMASAAAFKDPRFHPVTSGELPDLEIHLSILSKKKRVDTMADIRLGRHGVYLTESNRTACFLPEVAIEQGWDISTLLTHLSLKAGLPPTAWQEPDAIFEVFETERF